MPVKLFTGLPGAGKTACLVAEIVKLRETSPDRPIYQRGIDGLAEGLAEPLPDEVLHKWWELPPGAILCIDECQEPGLMPQDRGQPADWVRRISTVRHEGMDFLLTTQHPNMISSYVRRLVDYHVHAVRKFNTSIVERHMWGRCVEAPEKPSVQRGATTTVGTLPKEVFDLYKSASAHTMKRRIPKKVYILVFFVLVALCAIGSMPFVLGHMRKVSQDGIRGGKPVAAAGAARPVDDGLRVSDYGKWLRPRVAGLPWTAPAFDGQAVASRPAVYCIAVDDGRCHCISEQGTRLAVTAPVCRSIAAHGAYNPFLAPGDSSPDAERVAGSQDPQSPQGVQPANADPLPLSAIAPGALSGYKPGSIPQSYTPPEQLPPNS